MRLVLTNGELRGAPQAKIGARRGDGPTERNAQKETG